MTKPWGDSERYDFVLDSGRRLWRVQIKCTAVERAGGYHIQPIHFVYGKNKVVYTADDIDVLAAHVVPLDVWYVVPVEALAAGTSLRLYPDDGCKTARFEKYREGWDLFRGESADRPAERESGASGQAVPAQESSYSLLVCPASSDLEAAVFGAFGQKMLPPCLSAADISHPCKKRKGGAASECARFRERVGQPRPGS